jgi:hypothetical protein
MIVDYEMRNKRYGSVPIDPLPGQTGSRMPTIFGGMGPRIDERWGISLALTLEMQKWYCGILKCLCQVKQDLKLEMVLH